MSQALSDLRTPAAAAAPLSPFSRILKLLTLERADIGAILIHGSAVGITALVVPIAVQALVNSVAFTALQQPVVVLAVLTLLGISASGVARTLQAQVVETLAQRFFVRTAREVAERTLLRPTDSLRRGSPGQLATRFFEVVIVQKALSSLLVDGVSVTLEAAIGLLLLSLYHPALLGLGTVVFLGIAFIIFGFGRAGPETAVKESKAKYQVAYWLADVARAPRLFSTASARQMAVTRLEALTADYVHSRQKHFSVIRLQIAAASALQAIAVAALLGIGGSLVIEGQLSLGQLVAAEIVLAGVLGGVVKVGKHLETVYDLMASIDKLGTVIDLPTEADIGIRAEALNSGVTLVATGVKIAPPGPRLPEISLDVRPGVSLAILGTSGAGKTSLAETLAGFRPTAGGEVTLGGVNIKTVPASEWRAHVSITSSYHLFSGTLLENLLVGSAVPSAERLSEVLRAVELDHEFNHLPQGVHSPVGHGDTPLSPGQLSRLTIARTLLSNASAVIIDDSLDPLDAALAARIAARLKVILRDRALIVFTAREEVAHLFDETRLLNDRGLVSMPRAS